MKILVGLPLIDIRRSTEKATFPLANFPPLIFSNFESASELFCVFFHSSCFNRRAARHFLAHGRKDYFHDASLCYHSDYNMELANCLTGFGGD